VIKDVVVVGGIRHSMQIGMAICEQNVLTITSWRA
jgi:hypothetical protein